MPTGKTLALLTLLIQPRAIVAQTISACTGTALPLWDISAGRARTIVVMDTLARWLVDLVDRVERWD